VTLYQPPPGYSPAFVTALLQRQTNV